MKYPAPITFSSMILASALTAFAQSIPDQPIDPLFRPAPVNFEKPVELPNPLPPAPSKGGKELTWWRSLGTHYLLDPAAYLGTTRSYPTPGKLSLLPDVTSLPHEGVEPTIGKFSGKERFYDFTGTLRRAEVGHDYRRYLETAARAHVDMIWNLGQIHGAQKDHVKLVMENDGRFYKDLIYQAVSFAETYAGKDKRNEVYWEMGNEINSHKRFGLRELDDTKNQIEHAKDYLEYYLAPAVEAVRTASQDLYQDPRAIKVLLGNVTFIRDDATKKFLETILEGTVEGKHAPTLAGKKGHELVDALGIHYSHGTGDLLEEYYQRWIATGLVKGMWNTEELGLRGWGDYEIASVAFRWLDFWARKPWTPDTARLIFWGDRIPSRVTRDGLAINTSGEAMERHLGQFFRDFPLKALDKGKDFDVTASSDVETYALAATEGKGSQRVGVLVIPSKTTTISEVRLLGADTDCEIEAYIQPAAESKKRVDLVHSAEPGLARFDNLKLEKNGGLLLVQFVPKGGASKP